MLAQGQRGNQVQVEERSLLDAVLEATPHYRPANEVVQEHILETVVAPVVANWRALPPTAKQLAVLKGVVPTTRGEASDLINEMGRKANERRKKAQEEQARINREKIEAHRRQQEQERARERKKPEPCGCHEPY